MIEEIYDFWNIKPEHIAGDEFTGYESIYPQLDKCTPEEYAKDGPAVIQRVFDLYRSINLVPILYYTQTGLERAVREFKTHSYKPVVGDRLGTGNFRGADINRFIFTNMMTAEAKGRKNNSIRDRFFDDAKLRRAIKFCYDFREGASMVYPASIRRALELVTGENVTNFKAQNARAIVENLCPILWGRVYDYSCGFGGRLLGTTASNMNYTYVGTDPNTQTYKYLKYLDGIIGSQSEIVCETSQDYQPEDIDLAFSSPPYFNLEKYSEEPTQCMVQFSSLDDWFDGYVVPTMRNIHSGLNDDGVFATNIADYKMGSKQEFRVVDRWIQTATKLGFRHTQTIKMMLKSRPGVGNDAGPTREKWEGVYVFTK